MPWMTRDLLLLESNISDTLGDLLFFLLRVLHNRILEGMVLGYVQKDLLAIRGVHYLLQHYSTLCDQMWGRKQERTPQLSEGGRITSFIGIVHSLLLTGRLTSTTQSYLTTLSPLPQIRSLKLSSVPKDTTTAKHSSESLPTVDPSPKAYTTQPPISAIPPSTHAEDTPFVPKTILAKWNRGLVRTFSWWIVVGARLFRKSGMHNVREQRG